MNSKIARLALALLALSCVFGCAKAELDAEIVIVVDSDFAVPSQLNAVGFYVNRVGGDPANRQDIVVPITGEFGKTLPLRLGIAPEGDVNTAVEVIVEGYHYKKLVDLQADIPPPVVRRKARLRFQRGKVLLLRMDLVLACKDTFLMCEAQKGAGTCDEQGCADIEDPELHPWSGNDDAHSPWDAGST
jgi:hypothetical protein